MSTHSQKLVIKYISRAPEKNPSLLYVGPMQAHKGDFVYMPSVKRIAKVHV